MKEMVYHNRFTPEILDKGNYKEYHYAIVSLGSHLCVYVKLPEGNQYYGKDYGFIPIGCYGGLTYSAYGLLPIEHSEHKDGYWIGWDYAHCEDYVFYTNGSWGGHIWSTEEILSEVKQVINQFHEITRDTEKE